VSNDSEVIFRSAHGDGWGLMVNVNALCTFFVLPAQLSVACTVKLNVPEVDGAPEINPDALKFTPEGKAPVTIVKDTGDCPPEVVI
jgi:hypothetical protein